MKRKVKRSSKQFLKYEYIMWLPDPLINLIVTSLGYDCVPPLNNEENRYISDFLNKELINENNPLRSHAKLIEEKEESYDKCIENIKVKYSNSTFLIIGQCEKYLGIWPFGKKGNGVLAFINIGEPL